MISLKEIPGAKALECPSCFSKTLEVSNSTGCRCSIECQDCGLRGPSFYGGTGKEIEDAKIKALEVWNSLPRASNA